ncbi:hypothetical protein ACFY7V_03645 [[Kitasatospora] papulosa]|uniref:hypothetical protein n=1 Tax=Streptomyces TaxID=1883 RepID=UPI002FF4356B
MATTIPTAAAQVGEGRTPHKVRIDGFHANALCGRRVSRQYDEREAAKVTSFCKGCEKAEAVLLAETAAEEAPVVEAVETTATPAPVAEQEAPAQDEHAEDMPAGAECVHGNTERPGDPTRPAATCAAKGSSASVGIFGDEGCVDRSDCAVQASETVHRMNAEHDAEAWWAITCPAHEEEPAAFCEECAIGEDDEPEFDMQDDVYEDEPEGDDQGEQAPAAAAEKDAPTDNSLVDVIAELPADELGKAAVSLHREGEGVPATFAEGDRVLCVDGLVRTARYTEVKDGKVWIFMKDRSAWPRNSSELIDTSRVETVTADALGAAETLRATAAAPDPAALAELGDALRYLRHADPAAHAALIEGADRIAVRIPRADLAPGDVLHDQGPHDVLDVCTVAPEADAPGWWALILGHTKEVRAYTGRKPWPTALRLDLARADEVSVDRPLPGISPMPAPFTEGDRIVCADGTAHTVRAMSPIVRDEPARVVVEDGTEWTAENCRRANRGDIDAARRASARAADRVRINPNPADPEWKAALAELTTTLDFLKIVDPVTRAALVEDEAVAAVHAIHAEAHDFQPFAQAGHPATVGWSFRTGHGASARYGIVTTDAKLAPVGLYEYRTTAERAHLYADRRFTAVPVTG